MSSKKNLWILTEERPKEKTLKMIFSYFAKDQGFGFFGDSIRIIPLLDDNKHFNFTYKVVGFTCTKVNEIYIKTISGTSSFVDYLIFHQEEQPKFSDKPLYVIEETKTDDKESRNTGVFQRCSKFVYVNNFYPEAKKIMLYSLQVEQKTKPTKTYIFGTRALLTLGVEILGKKLDKDIFKPFSNIDEVVECKSNIRPYKGNVPVLITKETDNIQISGRLFKNNSLSHDPNIGALTLISAVLRKLGWTKNIEITQHGLSQDHIGKNNKFVKIANVLGISLRGLSLPKSSLPLNYWHYDLKGEKLGTIFIHIVVDNFTESYSVFENHAGCEKSYFQTSQNEYIPLAKYSDREKYKAGEKDKIISIPDLVLLDIKTSEAITIEGKKYEFRQKGIEELNNYDAFDNMYLKKYYPQFKVVRTVVLYGSEEKEVVELQVGFLLNSKGRLVLGIKAPKLFKRAINNLLDFWK